MKMESKRFVPPLYPTGRVSPAVNPKYSGSVAIIMRTKDRPLLLHRAIASVLCQTHEKWHLYLVNDGGNPEKIKELIKAYEGPLRARITVIHHPHSLGMENASNAGLALAKEEFVVVHDDDDSWHPEFLESTVKFLSDPENSHCVGVTTGCVVVQEQIIDDSVEEIARIPWVYNNSLIDMAEILKENKFPPICFLFRRAIIDYIGPFNGALPVLGDWEFNIRALLLGDIDFIDRPLAYYHHRQAASGVYGNSVVDGHAKHVRYNCLLRNSLLRLALEQNPANIGLMQLIVARDRAPISSDIIGHLERISHRMGQLEEQIRDIRTVASWTHKMLRPVRWFWVRAYPVRRLIAKWRGRI